MIKPDRIAAALKRLYAELCGERARLIEPPKRLTRVASDRECFESEVPLRERRVVEIAEALPHLEYVIRLYEPEWDATSARPIRPTNLRGLPRSQIVGAALEVLGDASVPLTIAEIVERIAPKHDLDLSTVKSRQKFHTAVNNGLKSTYGHMLVKTEGKPARWSLRRE